MITGNLTLGSGGIYEWQVASLTGKAGTSWDRIRVINGSLGGNLAINSTTESRFILAVDGLGSAPTVGSSYSWQIATFDGTLSYTGSSLNSLFNIQLGGTWAGLDKSLFSITNDANALYLNMAVPEPATYAMLLGAATLGLVGYRRWRRERPVA